MTTADVTVYGAGIFGLSCAWIMQRRGAQVNVIDPNGVAAGSSGGIVGALAPHIPENWNIKKQFQLDSLLMAAEFWADVEQIGGRPSGYARAGRLQPVMDERGLSLAQARINGAAEFWKGRATWKLIPVGAADGWRPDSPTGILIHDTLSARIHPKQACEALAGAFQAQGGRITREGAAQGQVLWATGVAGLHELNTDLGQEVGGAVKGQAALLDIDRRHAPQIFADGVHIVPHQDGTVAIGSTSERDPIDPLATDEKLDELIGWARRLCPVLADAQVVGRWAGLRPRSRSRAPMLGPWPGRRGHFIANGGFKIGFGMAPKVAEVMADLMLDGVDDIPDEFRVAASLRP